MLEFTFVYGEIGYELTRDMRKSVFGAELPDEKDASSYHLVGYDKTRQIAAARLTMLTDDICAVDHLAVAEDYRRQFVGDLAIKAIEDKAKRLGAKTAVAAVTPEAEPFFEFEYYEYDGEEQYGKRIMRKDLTKAHKCRGCG